MPPPPALDFRLVETCPALPGRLPGHRRDRTTSNHDLVEQMHYLYVKIVKAKHLLRGLNPCVEVKLDNYIGITRHSNRNRNPEWHQIFAFSREHLRSNLLEVVVKNKDAVKDDFVGKVSFELSEFLPRVLPDSPFAPQSYKLENNKGDKVQGKIILAFWMGTQSDDAYPDALHPGTVILSPEGIAHTRSQVYYSPKLYYLRLRIIKAQDLVSSHEGSRVPHAAVKVQLGDQVQYTRVDCSVNPVWNEELLFVVSKPFNEFLIFIVEDRHGPNMSETLGQTILPISTATKRSDHCKSIGARWFILKKPFTYNGYEDNVNNVSKIHLCLCLDAGYHVLTESTDHISSDLQPATKSLRNPSIGILELGILSARNLIPSKARYGRCSDAYCVAKYGSKWVRTRTVLDTCSPQWNEQYTWDVYDPCTVITIAVFDNYHLFKENEGGTGKDQIMGKVQIRLSTLETNRVYTHFYPLLLLQPSGVKKMGELHLALRFTCNAWMNMMSVYLKPLLPKMHHVQPISDFRINFLRHQAVISVTERLAIAETPLQKNIVEYMLDVGSNMWSLRQSKVSFYRLLGLVLFLGRWLDDVQNWRKPVSTCFVHVLLLIQVLYPKLILPMLFLKLFLIGVWNYQFRPWNPPHIDARLSYLEGTHPDEWNEEFDTFPTSCSGTLLMMRYDRLRSVASRFQNIAIFLATQAERVEAILSWRDPRATAIAFLFLLVLVVFVYILSLRVVCLLTGLYLLRHPRFRRTGNIPSIVLNFYLRVPTKSDVLIDTYNEWSDRIYNLWDLILPPSVNHID